jgi:hypothetical protein
MQKNLKKILIPVAQSNNTASLSAMKTTLSVDAPIIIQMIIGRIV